MGELEFFTLLLCPRNDLLYALLLKEAEAAGIVVTDLDIKEYFKKAGVQVGSAKYKQVLTQLRTNIGLGEKHLHAALNN